MVPLADRYLEALHFAARAHGEQKTLGGLPYVVHLSCVAMELTCALRAEPGRDEPLALMCALLHDVVEDTPTRLEQKQMPDSLDRILQQPPEVAMVKLADRITNTASPPLQWTAERVATYRTEAQEIHDALGAASPFLAERLRARIARYGFKP
jgi:(p)ppGpp synthase/HD superfamily hydrolase